MEWNDPVIIASAAGVLSLAGVIYQAWANRTREVSDATVGKITIESAVEMIEQLRKARDYWRNRAVECESREKQP